MGARAQPARTDCYVAGGWRVADDGRRFDVTDPATGTLIETVADVSLADGLVAVAAAHDALAAWALVGAAQRGEILRRAFELMTERADELARLVVAGERQGAPRRARRGGVRRGVLPLELRGGGAKHRRLRHRPRRHEPDPRAPPADRRRAPHHAVELPRGDADPQDRPRARRGVHGRLQAGAGDPAHRTGDRCDSRRGRRPPRSRERRAELATRTARRCGHRRRTRPQAFLHRFDRGRPDAPREGISADPQLLDGAWRERAVHRLR